jgi:hypothetical protein
MPACSPTLVRVAGLVHPCGWQRSGTLRCCIGLLAHTHRNVCGPDVGIGAVNRVCGRQAAECPLIHPTGKNDRRHAEWRESTMDQRQSRSGTNLRGRRAAIFARWLCPAVMCVEAGTDSHQECTHRLFWPRRLAEVHSTQTATANNLSSREIDVIEVQVALGGEHRSSGSLRL